MKKIISQISIIVVLMIIGMLSVFITGVNAESKAGINCLTSVNVGENFSVSLSLPSGADSAQSKITIKFSDGTTNTVNLVYMKGMENFPNKVVFKANVVGTATITASEIVISDSQGQAIENGGSTSKNINIVKLETEKPTDQVKPQEPSNPSTPSTAPTTPSNPDTNNNSNNNNNNEQVKFTDVNETVYTTENCNIRKSYSTSSARLGQVKKGTEIKRTGVGSNGWSRVEYNGQTAYMSSQYLTTEKPAEEEVKFTEVNETLYAVQSCNLRKSWTTESDKVGYLTEGQEVIRIGVADNGWSKIKYNGSEVYVATRLLTKEKPEEEPENEVTNNTVTNEIVEGEKTDLQLIQEEIGVIPDVGNNIAIRMYFIVTVLAVAFVCGGVYYININKNR